MNRILLVLGLFFGVLIGIGGTLTLALTQVRPGAPITPVATQDWEITLDLSDAFLAARMNNGGMSGGGNGGSNGGGNLPLALSEVQTTTSADGTVRIQAKAALAQGSGGTPPANQPRPPLPLPIGPGGSAAPGTGGGIPVEIVLRPTAHDGKVAVAVEQAKLGPIAIPGNLGSLLENPINNQLGTAMENEPFQVVNISTRQGAVVIQARRAAR